MISLSTGENLDDEQVEALFADCMDPEDDEGMIPYSRKYSPAELSLWIAAFLSKCTCCKRRLSIPHVTLCLRTNQIHPPTTLHLHLHLHCALCTVTTWNPNECVLCLRVHVCVTLTQSLTRITRNKTQQKSPNATRMVSLHGDCVPVILWSCILCSRRTTQSSSSAWWAIQSSSTKQ